MSFPGLSPTSNANHIGQLKVQCIEGKELPSGSLLDKLDPYCKLKLVNTQQSFKTKTHSNAGSTPKWNETFQFNILNFESRPSLHIECLESNLTGDSVVGTGLFDLTPILSSHFLDTWVPLTNKNNPVGQIRFLFEFIPSVKTPHPPMSQQYPNNVYTNQAVEGQNAFSSMNQQAPLYPPVTAEYPPNTDRSQAPPYNQQQQNYNPSVYPPVAPPYRPQQQQQQQYMSAPSGMPAYPPNASPLYPTNSYPAYPPGASPAYPPTGPPMYPNSQVQGYPPPMNAYPNEHSNQNKAGFPHIPGLGSVPMAMAGAAVAAVATGYGIAQVGKKMKKSGKKGKKGKKKGKKYRGSDFGSDSGSSGSSSGSGSD